MQTRKYVRFQMKHSTRPQTIAEVYRDVDINSFRSNPEWYEIIEEPVASIIVEATKPSVKRITKSNKGERYATQEG